MLGLLALLGILILVGFLACLVLRALAFLAGIAFSIICYILLGWFLIFLLHVILSPHFQVLLSQSESYFNNFILWQQ